MPKKIFFPIRMMTLRAGITSGVLLLSLLGFGIVSIPTQVWHPIIQLASFTILLVAMTPMLKEKIPLFEYISSNPQIALLISGAIVCFISFVGFLFESKKETCENFNNDDEAFCPPKLDFNFEKVKSGGKSGKCSSLDDNKLTEQQQLDQIDIYLRDSQESIARITGYLNMGKPDERWMTKKEMDDPQNIRVQ